MRKLSFYLLFAAVAFLAAGMVRGEGLVGGDGAAFQLRFPNNKILSGESFKLGESCATFVKDGWKGIACFRDGVCAVFLLFPNDDQRRHEEDIVQRLGVWHPGLVWTTKNGRQLCKDDICHGGLFPQGRGAYLILDDARNRVRGSKVQGKDMFTQSMTTAILRLGDPSDYKEGLLVWETPRMRIGIPIVSSSMKYIVWRPTRQRKMSEKKAMSMAKTLVSVEFYSPSYTSSSTASGSPIGYAYSSDGEEQYCLIRDESSACSYILCTRELRYRGLESMTQRLVYPKPIKRSSVSSTPRDEKPDSATSGTSVPGSTPAGQQPAVSTEPAPVTEKLPTHEDLLKLFIDSLEKGE